MPALALLLFVTVSVRAAPDDWDDDKQPCLPSVRLELDKFQAKYEGSHFKCLDGYAYRLFASSSADIFKSSPSVFVENNWKLFLASAPRGALEFRSLTSWDSQQAAVQQYRGIEIYPRWLRWLVWRGPEYRDFGMLDVRIVDTSDWNFPVLQKISCKEAVESARMFEASEGKSSTHRRYSCFSVPFIAENNCGTGPALVLRVDVEEFEGKGVNRREKDRRQLLIHGTTGKVCPWMTGWP